MKIERTGITKPPKIVIYGQHKIGKSELAAGCPEPIFIRTEDRHGHLSVNSFPLCKTPSDITEALDWLLTEKHEFRTVVLDTIDWAESIKFAFLCKHYGGASILDPNVKAFAYGGGYKLAEHWWEIDILGRLTRLNEEKKMMPLLLGHYRTVFKDDPRIGQYQKYEIDVAEKAGGSKILEWADIIGFMDWKTVEEPVETTKGETIKRVVNSGQRVLRLKPNLYWDAGQSYGLPDNIDLPTGAPGWPVIREAIRDALSKRIIRGNLGEVKKDKEAKALIGKKEEENGTN